MENGKAETEDQMEEVPEGKTGVKKTWAVIVEQMLLEMVLVHAQAATNSYDHCEFIC